MSETEKINGISSAAVYAKTGKTWEEWFAILDAAGAQQMKHPDIARLLQDQHGVPDWWCQMVTVGYEQARGMRAVHQKPDGFTASASKTVDVAVERLFEAWVDDAERARWLPNANLKVRKATANKSLRITWDDESKVDVDFYAKETSKSQVALQQTQLADPEAAQAAKSYWQEALARLKELLEQHD